MTDDALTRKDAEMLTREEIEELRPDDDAPMVADVRSDHLQALCDLALRALSLESVREEALREAADELERAFAECDTLNLLHGAARVRALSLHAPARVSEGCVHEWTDATNHVVSGTEIC